MGPEERSPRALRFWISSSRMILKLIVLLCLVSTALGSWFTNGFQRSKTLYCYIKTDSTKTRSNLMHMYKYNTHVGSCSRAAGRVPSRCTGAFPRLTKEFVAKNICQKVAGRIPANDPNGLKLPIYLTGKAHCTRDTSTNAWMDPVKRQRLLCKVVGSGSWRTLLIT